MAVPCDTAKFREETSKKQEATGAACCDAQARSRHRTLQGIFAPQHSATGLVARVPHDRAKRRPARLTDRSATQVFETPVTVITHR